MMTPNRAVSLLALILSWGLVTVPGFASGHDAFYQSTFLPSHSRLLMFTECDDLLPDIVLNLNGFCFPAGDVVPNDFLEATVFLREDSLFGEVSAYYCQDLDGDGSCGETCFDCQDQTLRSEPRFGFCNEAQLGVAIPFIDIFPKSMDDWKSGPNWEPGIDIRILLTSPHQGNVAWAEFVDDNLCPHPVSFPIKGVGTHT